jgi:predicted alpha/beta-hydrolase family hydrolase
MNPQHPVLSNKLEQVYLIERDAGLLCRILGLYASRGIDVLRAEYAYAAQDVMTLKVSVPGEPEGSAEIVRVLVDKAASLVGVLAAGEQPAAIQRVA